MLRLEIVGLQSQLEAVSVSEKQLDVRLSSRERELTDLQLKVDTAESRLHNTKAEEEKNNQRILDLEAKADALLIEKECQDREHSLLSATWLRKEAGLREKVT